MTKKQLAQNSRRTDAQHECPGKHPSSLNNGSSTMSTRRTSSKQNNRTVCTRLFNYVPKMLSRVQSHWTALGRTITDYARWRTNLLSIKKYANVKSNTKTVCKANRWNQHGTLHGMTVWSVGSSQQRCWPNLYIGICTWSFSSWNLSPRTIGMMPDQGNCSDLPSHWPHQTEIYWLN